MFDKQTVRDVPLAGQTVLVRADYNVPLDDEGKISDDFRIKASLPTLRFLLKEGCKIVIISHLGRPEGREEKYSLQPVADRLAELLKQEVRFVEDCVGDKVYQAVKKAPAKSIILLENLRFYKEEEANDAEFAAKLAKSSTARYFAQDGFGVVHRAHASTDAITMYLPGVAGLLLAKEYKTITEAMENPKRPLVAVIGGAKISDKIGVIRQFVKQADNIIIGGAMANTFLRYKGVAVGASKVEDGQDEILKEIYAAAKEKSAGYPDSFILLPRDVAVAKEISDTAVRKNIEIDKIESDDMVLDIGDETIERMAHMIQNAGTVIWNGTLGYAELPEFAHGSARLALSLATQGYINSIIGGGDTADFVLKWDGGTGKSFTHVSTGGGASLELMAGEKLPGVESLLRAYK